MSCEKFFKNSNLFGFKRCSKLFGIKNILRETFKNSDISITLYQDKIIEVTSVEQINEILKSYHESLLGGHVGISRMKNNIRRFYNWSTLTKDIRDFVKRCPICEKTKVIKHTKAPMMIRSTASEPFQKVFIDFVGEINPPSAKGHKYIFTAICDLSKFVIAVPTYDCTAETAARAFVKHIALKYNIPQEVISDNGTAFQSKLFHEITKLFKIKKIFTTPYRPQANSVERYHRSLNQYMRAYASVNQMHGINFLITLPSLITIQLIQLLDIHHTLWFSDTTSSYLLKF